MLATSDQAKRLLCVSCIERVLAGDLKFSFEGFKLILAELRPGFRLSAYLSRLEFKERACAAELGQFMDLSAATPVRMCAHRVNKN